MPKLSQDEKWLPVVGFEGVYEVSDLGRIKSLNRVVVGKKTYTLKGKILSLRVGSRGYITACLCNAGCSTYDVHRIVALAFLPNPDNKPQVNHKDGNKRNARLDNLEWVTPSENIQHAFDTRLIKPREYNENTHRVKDLKNIPLSSSLYEMSA